MIAARRTRFNFGLQRAVDWARYLGKPLVVLEALRCRYRWASDRLHAFVIQGMWDNQRALAGKPLHFYPYLEREAGAGRGLVAALAKAACVVISDDYPCFFLPHMVAAAARQIRVRFELVDSNGLLPMRAADRVFGRACDFRRFVQRNLLAHLADAPAEEPCRRLQLPRLEQLPETITRRWPRAELSDGAADAACLAEYPIDHRVGSCSTRGGSQAARHSLGEFLALRLATYASDRNEPDLDATSRLSPYLHFGQLSVHDVFDATTRAAEWNPDRISSKVTGSARGWWGVSESIESFWDELITWRELGFNFCWQRDDYAEYESLPAWARTTLDKHARDPRDYVYSLSDLETAATHDALWNAAQCQLVREGRIHNYLRMLWGKKILEWTSSPREALDVMLELNNKYALDGRDPNSYSGIAWVLGRYDRPWGPERPVLGTIRYMSSPNTARKLHIKQYLRKYAPTPVCDIS